MVQYTLKYYDELSTSELYDIIALRLAVFCVEQICPYQDLDYKDQSSYHLFGKNDQKLIVSYCRLLPPGLSYKGCSSIGRVVTHQSVRGKGEGWKMMEKSIRETLKLWPNMPIKISAQAHLDKFYGSLGFVTEGEVYLEDNIPHIEMIKY
jgi:ElaA protein